MKKKLLLPLIGFLVLTFFLNSCTKEDNPDSSKPYIGLWVVEKDTYQEQGGSIETSYYDDPNLYYINIKSNGTWTEEETYLGQPSIIRQYKYEIISSDSILCYTNIPSDGYKMRYTIDNYAMVLYEKGVKEVQGINIPYTYIRYLYK